CPLPQLAAAKVSKSSFRPKSGNSADISKAFFEMGVWKFESSQVSQAVRRSARLPKERGNGPEIRAFRSFDFVSGSRFAALEAELVESLRPCPRIFPFCGDCRRRRVRSLLPP